MGDAAENIAAVAARGTRGAKIGGIYMEGPYFSAVHKGAQNEAFLRDPDLDEFRALQTRAAGLIRIVSLAPERRGAADFIRAVTKGGAPPSDIPTPTMKRRMPRSTRARPT